MVNIELGRKLRRKTIATILEEFLANGLANRVRKAVGSKVKVSFDYLGRG